MATSILRLGRRGSLKCFQPENWILPRNHTVAWFSSHQEEPPMVPKKTGSKTVAPDERAALLAYRTAVIFPVKVSESPVFPLHSAGATTSDAAASAEPCVDPPPTDSATAKPADQAHEESSSSSSSSSSSDSDSDSESDSDDELSHVKTQTSEPTMQHQSGDLKVTSEVKDDSNESKPNNRHRSATEMGSFVGPEPDGCSAGTQGAAAEAVSEVLAEAEERGNTRESTEVPASPTGTEDVSPAALPADASTDIPAGTKGSTSAGTPEDLAVNCAEAADGAGAEDAEVLECSSTRVEAAAEPVEAVKSAAEVPSPTESSEELMDAAAVTAESVGEDVQPEGPFEEAAAAPPEPEEPLDLSTYKNYQHHSYHPFTFADMDVEMAKYRLPQPTANRH